MCMKCGLLLCVYGVWTAALCVWSVDCCSVCMECGLPLRAVLQVNLSPSFHTDSPLDKDIKDNLLFDALNLMNWTMASKQKCLEEQKKLLEERLLQRQKAKLSA